MFAPPQPGAPRPSLGVQVITFAEIRRSSATNVWDLLREKATGLRLRESPLGTPQRIETTRGPSSILLPDDPLVFADGVEMRDVAWLRQLPTDAVRSIQLMSGVAATPRFGTNAGSGVILITTRRGDESP